MLAFFAVLALVSQAQELKVSGIAGRDGVVQPGIVLSREKLASMPQVSVSTKDRDGNERVYEGVPLSAILRSAGQPMGEDLRGSLLARFVLAVAKDGYRVVFSLPEIDPVFQPNQILVAMRVNGKDLPTREGPFRLIVPGEKREARWLRMLERIEVVSAPEPLR